MQWHKIVFSNRPKHRIRRHLIFWFLWLIYIVFTIFFTPEPLPRIGDATPFVHHQYGLNELGYLQYTFLVLIKSLLLLLTHLFLYYAVIYISFPNFFLKKNYLQLFTGVVILCALIVALGYFLYSSVYPFIDGIFELHLVKQNKMLFYESIDASLINAIKLTLVIAAIKALKHWWLKQEEKEKLEKEKINTELQLLKTQIHPTFLFSTLKNIISHAQAASPQAPEMLIKLSDLLSYMLYECDAQKVMLEKEISVIKEYIALEKIRLGERLEMTFQIKGNLKDQLISPLLLLPFIDNSFSYCNNELIEQAWMNLDITIDGNNLYMKLINGLPAGTTGEMADKEQLLNVQKRLELLYPGRHELKINAEQEMLIVQLNVKLEVSTQEDPSNIEKSKPALHYA